MSEELETLITGDRKQRGCCSKHPVACSVVLGVLDAVCLAVVVCGALLHSTIDDKVQDAIAEQVKLKNGSAATDQFIHTKAPMYTTYFFYNVTNAKDVVKNGHKPNLVQLGPYAYKENRTCFDLRWHDSDSVLEYKTSVTYTFDPTVSVGNPDTDKVTTINMPLMGFFKEVEGIGGKAVDAALEAFDYMKMKFDWWDDGVFTKRTVSELLFGYDDPMLLSIKNDIHLLQKLHLVHRNLSIDPRFNYSHRSTVEEPNLVYTGVQNLSRANEYIMWNGNYNMSSWNNTWASAINGTGGYAFHPQVTKDEVLNVFIDEVYRSGYFQYDSEILDHGIRLYKYVLPQDELLNSTQRQYGFPSDNPSGVLNLTPNFDPPVEMFASKPHFLDADSVYRENVTGMSPNRSIHDSYMGVEPITGAVLNAAKRIQLNINVRRSSIFPELKNVRDVTMLPIYYGEQTGKVTSELANEFKAKVYAIKYGISGGVWAVVGVAGLVLVVSVMCFIGMMGQVIRHKISHSSSQSPLKLLTPDYFRTKRVVGEDGGTPAAAVSSRLIEPETHRGPTSESTSCGTNSVQYSRDQEFLGAREKSTSLRRTRSTPVAEAAIKREQENKNNQTSIDPVSRGSVSCDSHMSLEASATRDWSVWTPNDLDTTDIETTKPFVESATSSPTYSSSAGIDPCSSWGQSISTGVPIAMVPAARHSIHTQLIEGGVAESEQALLTDDELLAYRLQKEEYSQPSNWVTKDDMHIARVYQQDLDATAALELQQRETQYDTATGASYLYDTSQANSKPLPSSRRSVFAGHRPSSPTTGQHTGLEGMGTSWRDLSALEQDYYSHSRPEQSPQTSTHPRDLDWEHHQAHYEGSSLSGTRVPPVAHGGGATFLPHNMDMSYEALLALEDVAHGLSKKVLDHCTNTRSFKEKGTSPEHRTCAICLAEFREGQLMRYLPCLHSFHCHCIDQWLEQHNNCPVCMKNIEEMTMEN